jgi:Uma2 family endonuclease
LDGEGEVRYFPDIAFLSHDGPGAYDGTKFIGPPTLVAEVTSPESVDREVTEKKEYYLLYGVEWYWIVNTVTRVTEEYRSAAEGYALISQTTFTAPFPATAFPRP